MECADVKDDAFREMFSSTDSAIRRFYNTLPNPINTNRVLVSPLYILPHSFALAAMIQLHWIVAAEHDHLAPSYQKCLNTATDVIRLIDAMQGVDFSGLELHVSVRHTLTLFAL